MKTTTFRKIRLSALPMLCLWCATSTHGYSQQLQQKLKASFPRSQLLPLITRLDSLSGVSLSYSASRMPLLVKGPFPLAEKTVGEWLTLILQGTGVEVQTSGGKVQLIRTGPPDITTVRPVFTASGYLKDTSALAIADAVIQVKGRRSTTTSDNKGYFSLPGQEAGNLLLITHIGHITREVKTENSLPAEIVLLPAVDILADSVVVSTGMAQYQKARAAGSFTYAGPHLLNSRISTSFTDRLDGIMSGLQFIKNIPSGSAGNESSMSIRGRSTLWSNAQPLIVLDGFPYHGSLENLNPADILSVTLLKDAAAASIWGAFSSNGVIVIVTRQGSLHQAPQASFIANYTYLPRPDLGYIPMLNSTDYIAVEQFLFQNRYYDYSGTNYSYLSPVVEILASRQKGLLDSAEATAQIQQLRNTNALQQLAQLFYRPGFYQQYAVTLSGGDKSSTYYLSAGIDRNQQQLVRNSYDRFTTNLSTTFHLIPNRLTLITGTYITQSLTRNNNNGGPLAHPYDGVVSNGKPTVVSTMYRQSFKDASGLNLNFYPLLDLYNSNNVSRLNEFRTGFQLHLKPVDSLLFTLSYQYYKGLFRSDNIKSIAMHETRNLFYSYSRLQPDGTWVHAIPEGGIADLGMGNTTTQNARAMVQYTYSPGPRHKLVTQAGADLRVVTLISNSARLYGYQPVNQMNTVVDYTIAYAQLTGRNTAKIPDRNSGDTDRNNYLSHYASINYTYNDRFSALFSYRIDASNLFGARANSKWLPLWSAGVAGRISPQVKLKASIGYSGNVNTMLSPLNTATRSPTLNRFNAPVSTMVNPNNPLLDWEKVRTINIGADFQLLRGRLSGSLEVYRKDGRDLIGQVELDPTAGLADYTGNFAQMRTQGADLTMQLLTNTGQLSWNTTLLLSYNKDKVTRILARPEPLGTLATIGQLHAREGYSAYSLYSFPINHLNSSGHPVVMVNGAESTAYADILNSTDKNNLPYSGPVNPTWFGSVRNSLSWKKFTLAVLFTFKAGHVFRRPGINYNALYLAQSLGHADIHKRWQKPGDEFTTTVPVMPYPAMPERDVIYNNSTLLVEPGAHIRAKDLLLSYELTRKQFPGLPFSSLKLYSYINNLGIVWKATKTAIDPDYVPYGMIRVLPEVRTYGAGMTVYF